ncbi:MAG: spore coat protein [Ruminococcaceae bacterium]|nr:spore coat protein [Oscillospiraceae bacterium]
MTQLTGKELTAINEQLEAEKVVIAKYRMYANNVQDTELKTRFEAIASRHCQHYDKLYSLLG